MPKWLPGVPEIAREAVIVMAGALIAAIVVRNLPDSAKSYFTWPGQPGQN